ncbi:MAG: hypothetical protein ACYC4K_01295 [Thiobacillus sp.]
MLNATYRIQVQNSTGAAFGASDTISVLGVLYSFSSTGVLTYSAETTLLPTTSGNSLAAGAFANGATQTGNTNLGGNAIATASITPTPTGNLNFFLQISPDGGTTWPANGQGQLIGVMSCTVAGVQPNIQMSF